MVYATLITAEITSAPDLFAIVILQVHAYYNYSAGTRAKSSQLESLDWVASLVHSGETMFQVITVHQEGIHHISHQKYLQG